MAEEKGFDLVEVSPGAKPPVVKMMDYGKYKYEQQKKAAEARKRQKVIEIKEIKMRPTIDDHDYDTKMRSMKRFFEEGDKVKVTLSFRGREMAHQNIGMELLTRIQKETDSFAKIEQYPRLEGRQMQMVLAPRTESHPLARSRSMLPPARGGGGCQEPRRLEALRQRVSISGSMLPPESTIAIVRPFASNAPDRAAARPAAPPGSTTSFSSRTA